MLSGIFRRTIFLPQFYRVSQSEELGWLEVLHVDFYQHYGAVNDVDFSSLTCTPNRNALRVQGVDKMTGNVIDLAYSGSGFAGLINSFEDFTTLPNLYRSTWTKNASTPGYYLWKVEMNFVRFIFFVFDF